MNTDFNKIEKRLLKGRTKKFDKIGTETILR